MKIKARHPDTHPQRNLLNAPALGRVRLTEGSEHVVCELLTSDGNTVTFNKDSNE